MKEIALRGGIFQEEIVIKKLTRKIWGSLTNLAVIGQVDQQKQSQDKQEYAFHLQFPVYPSWGGPWLCVPALGPCPASLLASN